MHSRDALSRCTLEKHSLSLMSLQLRAARTSATSAVGAQPGRRSTPRNRTTSVGTNDLSAPPRNAVHLAIHFQVRARSRALSSRGSTGPLSRPVVNAEATKLQASAHVIGTARCTNPWRGVCTATPDRGWDTRMPRLSPPFARTHFRGTTRCLAPIARRTLFSHTSRNMSVCVVLASRLRTREPAHRMTIL